MPERGNDGRGGACGAGASPGAVHKDNHWQYYDVTIDEDGDLCFEGRKLYHKVGMKLYVSYRADQSMLKDFEGAEIGTTVAESKNNFMFSFPDTSVDAPMVFLSESDYNSSTAEKRLKETVRLTLNGQSFDVNLKISKNGGCIEIPKMELTLPLYVGSSAENMSRGATIIGQTSFPVGGANTNSVIAGHRGYQGIPFFREIEKLEPGDSVFIYGPWETLEYIVSETMVIEPNDINAVYIQPGRDMVTLITCHPYMSHGRYRYLVYCHRKGEEPTPIPKEYREKEVVFESSEELIQADNLFYYAGGVVILFLLVLLFRKK